MLIILEFIRPNTEVKWPSEIMPDWVSSHMQETYKDAGRLIEEIIQVSEDNLSMTWTFHWHDNHDTFAEFVKDQVVNQWKKLRKDYCINNNIIIKDAIIKYHDPDLTHDVQYTWHY